MALVDLFECVNGLNIFLIPGILLCPGLLQMVP